jgi:hypothetical protein
MKPQKLSEKVDFRKSHKALYTATAKIKEISVDRGAYLSESGQGAPGGPEFQASIQKLYTVAYTAKFSLRASRGLDFGIPCLECLWHLDDPVRTPKDEWKWQLLIRIPEEVTAADLKAVAAAIREKKGLDVSSVERLKFEEGDCLQTMHVGPYDQVGVSYDRLFAHARERGLAPKMPCHEIYVSDPRRVAPEKLKTIVRLPVRPA